MQAEEVRGRCGCGGILAARKGESAALVMAMSEKLETQIRAEIGVDDGREMPRMEGVDWTIDSLDL